MKEKILIICYRRPYPLNTGAEVRMFQHIEILSEFYDIDVAYVSENEHENDYLNEICNNVIVIHKNKIKEYFRAVLFYMFCNMPLQIGQSYYKELNNWVIKHYKQYKFIMCEHIKTAPYIMNLSQTSKKDFLFFDGTDAVSLYLYNTCKLSKGIKKLVYGLEYKRMLKYEKKVYETIKNTILISERDKSYIINNVKAICNPATIFNYAIDLGYKPIVDEVKYSISFIGRMDYAPNVAAVTYFVERIYGNIKQKITDVSFHILGGHVCDSIKKFDGNNGIVVHGFVNDAAYYLQRSTVVIAPMRSGAGLQNKIIQAMYLGCTVITSELGADGLADLVGNEIVIYMDDADFINKLLFLLSDQAADYRKKIGQRAREYINRIYSYSAIRKQIIDLFSFYDQKIIGESGNV